MNVFLQELKANVRGALLWAASLALVGLLVMLMLPILMKDMQPMMQMIKSLPPAALLMFNLSADSISSFNGFYSFMFVFIVLCAAIQGLIFGIASISVEGARKTSDFLFTKPLSRVKILMAKYWAAFTLMLCTSAIYAAVTWLAATANIKDLDVVGFWLFTGAFAMTQLFCLSIGFCVGCCVRRIKAPNSVGVGLGALFFALLMVENLSDQNSIAFLTPLAYLNPSYIAAHRAYDMPYFWALIALSVGLVCAGVWRYNTRDIHAA